MSKCFITKLPSSIDNNNLPVLGQFRIKWLKDNHLVDNDQRAIGLATNNSITVKVSGAHFTDSTLTSNVGNIRTITADNGLVWLYVSNDADSILTIDNKYSLITLNFVKPNKDYLNSSVYFDIEDIRYCTELNSLYFPNTQVGGDISALSNLTKITWLTLANTKVSGDISVLRNLTDIRRIDATNTSINGDISALSNLTGLITIDMNNTQVGGDISALSNLTNLDWLALSNTQIGGDISALSNLTNLTVLSLNSTQVSGAVDNLASLNELKKISGLENLSLTGDMSKIPTKAYFITQNNRKITTNFTWTAKGRQNATLLAMEGAIPFDTTSMDNMLIDQATCSFKLNTSDQKYNVISVNGNRTSASDAAVTAIQNMGVTITGVTKVS